MQVFFVRPTSHHESEACFCEFEIIRVYYALWKVRLLSWFFFPQAVTFDLEVVQTRATRRLKAETLYFPTLKCIK